MNNSSPKNTTLPMPFYFEDLYKYMVENDPNIKNSAPVAKNIYENIQKQKTKNLKITGERKWNEIFWREGGEGEKKGIGRLFVA